MYTNKIYAQLFLSGIAGGFLSGAVNFGASLAVLPVLLKLGMHPRVASAVSGNLYLIFIFKLKCFFFI